MAKKSEIKSKRAYELQFRKAVEASHGEWDEARHGLAVMKAAADFHLLDVIDAQIDGLSDFVTMQMGSTGQVKQEVNPLLMVRDKISRTAMDALDALMLTPRAKYKKAEGNRDAGEKDPMKEFMEVVNKS